MTWVNDRLYELAIAGPDNVPALAVTYRDEKRTLIDDERGKGVRTTTRTMHLFGGVDLTVTPVISAADTRTTRLGRAAADALANARGKETFNVEFGGNAFAAKVLTIGRAQSLAQR